ncbi:MAG TPA: transglycosylase domain-containing protein [Candidatus Angelobacter sp.]|nr:transglycosylase domain-containing protein [Candidatus Angelobacter sp.]
MSQRSTARGSRATTVNGRRRRSSLRTRTGLRHRRGVRILLFALATLCGLGLVGVAVVYAEYQNLKSQLPSAATLAAMEPSTDSHVYAADGTLIGVLHNSDFRHEHIALSDLSRFVKLATIDVEDKHFYENSSWDLPRIIKAAYDNLRGQANAGGASTITEQLAKISFLSPERSLDRKIKQVILGAQIEGEFTKNQILEMYLNRIPYGNHAIGIQSAAETYFKKSAHDLDLAEASMLVGLPNSPTAYNPLNHEASADVNPLSKQRQKVVLDAMVTSGDITRAQADAAFAEKLTYYQWYDSEPSLYPNFMQFVRGWLDTKYGDAYIKPGGWDIHTTIDPAKQKLAEQTLHDGVAKIANQYNAHDGALVSLDPKTGAVLALIGTADPNDPVIKDRNLALEQRQPGSTIKLFTYTAAIASRQFTMTTPILDAPIALPIPGQPPYSPKNYDHSYHGTCQLQMCLGNSFNIPAVKTEAKVGIPFITDLEIAAGLKTLADPANRPGPMQYSATLGGLSSGLTPLELADAVATIADGGVQHDPTPVSSIVEHATNKTVYVHDPAKEGRRVLPENVAYIMAQITSNDRNRYVEFGPSGPLTLKDRRVSAKTGTTENFVLNWTVGWTPNLVGVVVVGNPWASCVKPEDQKTLNNLLAARHSDKDGSYPFTAGEIKSFGLQPLNNECGALQGSSGITGAAPIWHDYMTAATADQPKDWYTRPPDIVSQGSGDNANFFIPGTETTCVYYAPAPDPNNSCQYSGTTPPTPAPTPGATPAPGAPPTPGPPATPPPATPTPKPHG